MRVLWLSPWLRPLARANVEGLRALGVEVMLITAPLHPESDALREYEVELLAPAGNLRGLHFHFNCYRAWESQS